MEISGQTQDQFWILQSQPPPWQRALNNISELQNSCLWKWVSRSQLWGSQLLAHIKISCGVSNPWTPSLPDWTSQTSGARITSHVTWLENKGWEWLNTSLVPVALKVEWAWESPRELAKPRWLDTDPRVSDWAGLGWGLRICTLNNSQWWWCCWSRDHCYIVRINL